MAKMKTYNVNVRLGGNILHSVPRNNVTERELYLLSQIHGSDAIIGQVEVGEVDVTEKLLDFQLAREYGRRVVETHFSKALLGYDEWLVATVEQEEQALYDRMEARNEAANVVEAAKQAAETKPAKQTRANTTRQTPAPAAEQTAATDDTANNDDANAAGDNAAGDANEEPANLSME
jgi:hypothetical protein